MSLKNFTNEEKIINRLQQQKPKTEVNINRLLELERIRLFNNQNKRYTF